MLRTTLFLHKYNIYMDDSSGNAIGNIISVPWAPIYIILYTYIQVHVYTLYTHILRST